MHPTPSVRRLRTTRLGRVSAALGVVVGLATGAAGCRSSILPNAPSTGPNTITLIFSGTLPTGGRSFFSFLVSQKDIASVLFASTMETSNGHATPVPASLGLGIPGGTDCVLSTPAIIVGPAFTPQIARELEPGTYCIRIEDIGGFFAPMEFAIRLVVAAGTPDPSPGVQSFGSSLAVQGASARVFTASQSGTISLTLQSLGGDVGSVGLGLGIPRSDGAGCLLTRSVTASPGGAPQLSAQVAPGTYCAKVFDAGTLTRPVTFVLQIVFP